MLVLHLMKKQFASRNPANHIAYFVSMQCSVHTGAGVQAQSEKRLLCVLCEQSYAVLHTVLQQ